MAKIEERRVAMYQCDECTYQGEEVSMKQCRICSKDLCPMHVTRIILSHSREAAHVEGYFCLDHSYYVMNELSELLGGQVVQYKQEDLWSRGEEQPKVKFWEVPQSD